MGAANLSQRSHAELRCNGYVLHWLHPHGSAMTTELEAGLVMGDQLGRVDFASRALPGFDGGLVAIEYDGGFYHTAEPERVENDLRKTPSLATTAWPPCSARRARRRCGRRSTGCATATASAPSSPCRCCMSRSHSSFAVCPTYTLSSESESSESVK